MPIIMRFTTTHPVVTPVAGAFKAIQHKMAEAAGQRLTAELLKDRNADLWFVNSGAETFTVTLEVVVEA